MQALVCEKLGSADALRVREWPMPYPKSGQVRIRVHAAGVNFPDTLIVQGKYHVQASTPFIPGSEVAGIIDLVADDVQGWNVGDRVCAMTTTGGFAEAVVVDTCRLVALPTAISFHVGSAASMTYGTAIHALRQRAILQTGERLLVLGAGGGAGLAAVAVGTAMGAKVIAVASKEDKLELARQQGAIACVNSSDQNVANAAKQYGPIDVIFDPVGGSQSESVFRALAPDGRHLVIGFASGEIPSIPLNLPLLKSASIVGVFWGAFATRSPDIHRANMLDVFTWFSQGRLTQPDLHIFSLDRAHMAIQMLAGRSMAGKGVIDFPGNAS